MHIIRLRGSWEITHRDGATTHRRNFGRPRTLDPGERVWLVCARVPGPGDVTINGGKLDILPAAGPFSADVTDRLRDRNVLAFVVASDEPLGEVTLEIRSDG